MEIIGMTIVPVILLFWLIKIVLDQREANRRYEVHETGGRLLARPQEQRLPPTQTRSRLGCAIFPDRDGMRLRGHQGMQSIGNPGAETSCIGGDRYGT